MSLTDEMGTDLEYIAKMADRAREDLKNGRVEQAEERLTEIKQISASWK